MLWGGDWLYLADCLSKTHTLNLKNPLYYFPHPCGGGLRGRVSPIIAKPCDSKTKQSKNQMQIQPRHCEIFARKSKQSILATLESCMNHLLYANLWLDLLIRFWVIYFLYLLTARGLDCFGDKSPRNDSKNSPSLAEIKGGG